MGSIEAANVETPFWNVNVPKDLQTEDCPNYLQYAFTNEKDRQILRTPDNEYKRQSWQQVQEFIRTNRIDLFQRLPSDLRRYREYCAKIVEDFGTVMAFVMKERLRWHDLTPVAAPFQSPGKRNKNQCLVGRFSLRRLQTT